MFWNYFLIAFRILSRSKAYSFINIFGLALGITCCLLLSLYIQDELRFDTHHKRLDDLYRITTHFDVPRHGFDKIATVSPPVAATVKNEVPEIEAAARLFPMKTALFKCQEKSLYEDGGFTADSTIFDVLTYEFIEGEPATALTEANTVVLTEKLSKKLFGNVSGLNKTVVINQNESDIHFKVTGIVRDIDKTHIPVNYFIAITSEGDASYFRSEVVNSEWAGMQFVIAYVKLAPHHNKEHVVKKINDVLQRHGEEDMKALGFTKKTRPAASERHLFKIRCTAKSTHRLFVRNRLYCLFYPANSLHQLHEPLNGKGNETCFRVRCAQSHGGASGSSDETNFW